MKTVKICDRSIGDRFPTYIIAEIGGNFSNYETGIKLINSAIANGADAVKIQTFIAKNTVSKFAKLEMPVVKISKSQLKILGDLELDRKIQKRLFDYCKSKKIVIFSSPSHITDVDFLEENDMCAYKLGSDDLTNIPLIKYISKLKKPTIISTGMSNLSEVKEAVNAFYLSGNKNLVLLHCVSMYPFSPKFANLKAIETMKKKFDIPVGWSDHTGGTEICIAASALGANVIEKHVMLDRKTAGPDYMLSANPKQLCEMVKTIRIIEESIGDGVKKPALCEVPIINDVRKSIIARKKIKKGEKISMDLLEIKRPGNGIPPKFIDKIIGRKTLRAVRADEFLRLKDLK